MAALFNRAFALPQAPGLSHCCSRRRRAAPAGTRDGRSSPPQARGRLYGITQATRYLRAAEPGQAFFSDRRFAQYFRPPAFIGRRAAADSLRVGPPESAAANLPLDAC